MSYPENVVNQMEKLELSEVVINNIWTILEKLKDSQALYNVGISPDEDGVILQWPRFGTFCAVYENKAIIHLVKEDQILAYKYDTSHKEYYLTDDLLIADLKNNLVKLV